MVASAGCDPLCPVVIAATHYSARLAHSMGPTVICTAGVADGRDIVAAYDRFAQSGEGAGLEAPELQQMMRLEAWLTGHEVYYVFAGRGGTWVAEPAAG